MKKLKVKNSSYLNRQLTVTIKFIGKCRYTKVINIRLVVPGRHRLINEYVNVDRIIYLTDTEVIIK